MQMAVAEVMEIRDAIDQWGGRRFLLTAGCAWISTALLMGNFISESIFRDLIIATVAAYITGNTVQKVTEK